MGLKEVVVAGHICLDVIPGLGHHAGGLDSLLVPGKLVHTGPALLSTGGAVSNTGLALHRLGVPVSLMGKLGEDTFGKAVLEFIDNQGEGLSEDMIVAQGEATSYSIVINPSGVDRMFLHCPGANDTFRAADVDYDRLHQDGVRLFHFGYPPLMRSMYASGGQELASMLARVKKAGVTTTMDMAKPDPASEAGVIDWAAVLQRVLPHVDVFLPSFDELVYMLDRPLYDRMSKIPGEMSRQADASLLAELSARLISMGAAIVAIKLGEDGLYLRTSAEVKRLEQLGACRPGHWKAWVARELMVDCYEVDVQGTTGAGDCTIAGLLTALVKGLEPEASLRSAVAVGACNVERTDAISGIPSWDSVRARIAAGWTKRQHQLQLVDWVYDAEVQLWYGPADTRNLD